MTDIRFYHLVQKRLEQALPEIAQKAFERGHRLLIKTGSAERLEVIDTILWTHEPASFLPHGRLRDGFEADQPVFLTLEDDNPNKANVLILADGASSNHVADFALCCEMFDGNDDSAVSAARARWKAYKEAGHQLSYYQQNDQGRWELKAS